MKRFLCRLLPHRWTPVCASVRQCDRCGVRQQWLRHTHMNMRTGEFKDEWKWR